MGTGTYVYVYGTLNTNIKLQMTLMEVTDYI